MFSKRIDLFTLLGFRVSLDLSWFLLAILIVWTLAGGYFPAVVPDRPLQTYLWMGVAGALGLFASIVAHEFAHALVARRYDLPMAGITLFIFGGVAEMSDEPERPMVEFLVAIAGPIASYIVAGVCYLAGAGLLAAVDAPELGAVIYYLALINFVLATFNLLPAFPLDGGRILRSLLWWWQGSLRKATHTASRFGVVLAAAIMALGVVNIVSGMFIAGLWQLLIGFFIYNAAGASRVQLALRNFLKGMPIRRVTNRNPVTVTPDMPVRTLVEDYFYRHHHKFFPVVEGDRVAGCVTVKQVSGIGREDWDTARVRDVMTACGEENTVAPDEDALAVLRKMQNEQAGHHYLVVNNDRLEGLVTLKDLMSYLAIRLELEEDDETLRAAIEPRRDSRALPG